MPNLVLPNIKYEKSFLEAAAELQQTERANTVEAQVDTHDKFVDHVDRLLKNRTGLRLLDDHVASTEWWLVDSNEYIGRIGIRHQLSNSYLLELGGHIGYVIRPSKRNSGYGSMILKLGLIKAKKLGLKKVLIICDVDNYNSQKIIEKNGGFFERLSRPNGQKQKRRYWIEFS